MLRQAARLAGQPSGQLGALVDRRTTRRVRVHLAGFLKTRLLVARQDVERSVRFPVEHGQLAREELTAAIILASLGYQRLAVGACTQHGGSVVGRRLTTHLDLGDIGGGQLLYQRAALQGVEGSVYVRDAADRQHIPIRLLKALRQVIPVAGALDDESQEGPVDR